MFLQAVLEMAAFSGCMLWHRPDLLPFMQRKLGCDDEMKKRMPKIVLYIAILCLLFFVIYYVTSPDLLTMTAQNGWADLTGIDLGSQMARLSTENWEYYPEVLYDPQDLPPPYAGEITFAHSTETAEYGTYRLTLMLQPGQIYAISGRSPNLSQRLYIDGQLAGEVGSPGSNREETTPRTKTYGYYFMAVGDTTEFVFHIANFHHREGGKNTPLFIAYPSVLHRYRALEFIRNNIILGCVLAVSLYFLGLFIFSSDRKHFLFLSLAAFVTAFRMLLIGEKHIMEIFPALNWFLSIRLEYICLLLFVVFLLLYFHFLYPGMIHRRIMLAIFILSGLFFCIVLAFDSLFFTRIQPYYMIVWVAASLITLWGLFRTLGRKAQRSTHLLLILWGFIAFFACALYDELRYLLIDHVRLENTLITGMLVCLYMNMIASTLEFSETEKEISESRLSMMLSQLQPHFLYNILIVIGQLCDSAPGEAKKTVLDFADYLRNNLDSLFERAPIPFEKELQHVFTYLSLEQKRFGDKIRFHFDIESSAFLLPALTLQPIVENAVRYGITKREEGGTITLSVKEEDRHMVITIADDGIGFDVSDAKQDGRSHRGIENVQKRLTAMCKGELHIHSTPGVGTEVTLRVPKQGKRGRSNYAFERLNARRRRIRR